MQKYNNDEIGQEIILRNDTLTGIFVILSR